LNGAEKRVAADRAAAEYEAKLKQRFGWNADDDLFAWQMGAD